MVYSIYSVYLNYDHISPTGACQIFGCAFNTQRCIILERLNQIFIVAHFWKEEILSFSAMCHFSKSTTTIKFKRSSINYGQVHSKLPPKLSKDQF